MKKTVVFRIYFNTLVLAVWLISCSTKKDPQENVNDTVPRDSITLQHHFDTSRTLPTPDTTAIQFHNVKIEHPRGDTFELSIPDGFKIDIVAHGMKRIRFMDYSPDGRIFLTDMHNLADNKKGMVIILDEVDSNGVFQKQITYLEGLRNPNSLKFHRDRDGKTWLYLALTDKLVRYPFNENDTQPHVEAEVLDTYPDYGLSYRYGGWHLTRTIEFDDQGHVYVSVGSSCNVCIEKEPVRASVVMMDEDGKNKMIFAHGLRNAVGLTWVQGNLYATNMAADHLGKDSPDDAMFKVLKDHHYGWPYCFHVQGKAVADPKLDTAANKVLPQNVPNAYSAFGAHTAPLGLAWFGESTTNHAALKNYFLVAQHGSYSPTIGRGYSIQRVREGAIPEDFVKGFLDAKGDIHGRPCGILPHGQNSFYFTDDKFGTVYHVYPEVNP